MSWYSFWTQVLVVMLGGALGAATRFLVGVWIGHLKLEGFPWATFLVNLAGCFLIGLLFVAAQKEMPQLTKVALGIGFLGALTTFSTFSLDTLLLWSKGQAMVAAAYSISSVVFGLVSVALGQMVGHWWLGPIAS